jgi:hypothetical protein
VLGLGAGEGRFPRGVAVGHRTTVSPDAPFRDADTAQICRSACTAFRAAR